MQNDTDDLLEAVDKIADTDFDANDIDGPPVGESKNIGANEVAKTFGTNRIAERRSGSATKGFYRPGERAIHDGGSFEVAPPKFAKYSGPPSGRSPTNEEKRGAWQLQEEYLAGRLGKNDEENSRNWNTAIWIDRQLRTATMPAEAVKGSNVCAGGWEDVARATIGDPEDDPADSNDGYGVEVINIDERDKERLNDDRYKERLAIKLSDYDLARLVDDLEEFDETAKIDVNKLARNADPLAERIDLPGPIERQAAIKILRMLMLGMRSLWYPVIRSIADHSTMTSLGKTQGVGNGVAAAVGRQRVIEGLRLAESIRKGLSGRERSFSMCQNLTRAKQELVPSTEWRLTGRYKMGSVDDIITGTLAILPDKSLPKPVHAPDKLSPANDNFAVGTVASNAA